jgi:hypothetical protein
MHLLIAIHFLEVLRNKDNLIQILRSSYNDNEWIRSAYLTTFIGGQQEWQQQTWDFEVSPLSRNDIVQWMFSKGLSNIYSAETIWAGGGKSSLDYDGYYNGSYDVIIGPTDDCASLSWNLPMPTPQTFVLIKLPEFNHLILLTCTGDMYISPNGDGYWYDMDIYNNSFSMNYPEINDLISDIAEIMPIYKDVMMYADNNYAKYDIYNLEDYSFDDLDNIQTPGFYYTARESIASGIVNQPPYAPLLIYPFDESYAYTFFLEVLEDRTQIWRSFYDGIEYRRIYDGNTYTSWVFRSWKKTLNENDNAASAYSEMSGTNLGLVRLNGNYTFTGTINVATPTLPT